MLSIHRSLQDASGIAFVRCVRANFVGSNIVAKGFFGRLVLFPLFIAGDMRFDLCGVQTADPDHFCEDAGPDVTIAASGVIHRSCLKPINDIRGVNVDLVAPLCLHSLHDHEQAPQLRSWHGLLTTYPREEDSNLISAIAHDINPRGDGACSRF